VLICGWKELMVNH